MSTNQNNQNKGNQKGGAQDQRRKDNETVQTKKPGQQKQPGHGSGTEAEANRSKAN